MNHYFMVTAGIAGPRGHIYHEYKPNLERSGSNGHVRMPGCERVLYGPEAIPESLIGQPIAVLMAVWRGDKPKLRSVT